MQHPFYVTDNGNDEASKVVELRPALAIYKAQLEYDDSGNANLVIRENGTDGIVLDMSLDSGEVNYINKGFFS